MREKDLKIPYPIEYHSELNDKFWKDEKLLPNIRGSLLKIANEFINTLKLENINIQDIVFTGSLANYNYTQFSDVDIHVIIHRLSEDLMREYFDDKKDLFRDNYNISVRGYPVEMYVQYCDEVPKKEAGVYSLLNNKWVQKPIFNEPKTDRNKIEAKINYFVDKFNKIKKHPTISRIKKLKHEIYVMRSDSLEKDGEFSLGNIVFKTLRKNGILDSLRKMKNTIISDELSI